jgi:hypothetical protein
MSQTRTETPVYSRDQGLTQKIEYDGSNNAVYIGKAQPGTVATASTWQICKLTYDASNNMTDLQWANSSDNFEFIWNSRATYTYA